MANDRVDEFHYRGFIPEEGRGGTYSVTLFLDGKYVGPMPPHKADALGWPLTRIVADLNGAAISQLSEEREKTAALSAQVEDADGKITALQDRVARAESAETRKAVDILKAAGLGVIT